LSISKIPFFFGEFTQSVLDEAKERLEERYRLQAQVYDLDKVSI
jgi:hypothetical protein